MFSRASGRSTFARSGALQFVGEGGEGGGTAGVPEEKILFAIDLAAVEQI